MTRTAQVYRKGDTCDVLAPMMKQLFSLVAPRSVWHAASSVRLTRPLAAVSAPCDAQGPPKAQGRPRA